MGVLHVDCRAVHKHCTALCSCTDEDNSPTGPTMGAVHVEQYIHTVQHYVAVQMRTILLLDQQWEQSKLCWERGEEKFV
jgi:hypothetical protein